MPATLTYHLFELYENPSNPGHYIPTQGNYVSSQLKGIDFTNSGTSPSYSYNYPSDTLPWSFPRYYAVGYYENDGLGNITRDFANPVNPSGMFSLTSGSGVTASYTDLPNVNLGDWTGNAEATVQVLQLSFTTAGNKVFTISGQGADVVASFTLTAATTPSFTSPTDITPMNLTGAYEYQIEVANATPGGTWSNISGNFPPWLYNIQTNNGKLQADPDNDRAFNDATRGVYEFTLGYTPAGQFLNETTIPKLFRLRTYTIKTERTPNNKLADAQVGVAYTGLFRFYGDLNTNEVITNYNGTKPSAFNGFQTAIGKFSSNCSDVGSGLPGTDIAGVNVSSYTNGGITYPPDNVNTISVPVSVTITKDHGNSSLPSGSFTVTRNISLEAVAATKDFKVTPNYIITKAEKTIAFVPSKLYGTFTDTQYKIQSPWTAQFYWQEGSEVQIAVPAGTANGTYNIAISRDGIIKYVTVVVDSTLTPSVGPFTFSPNPLYNNTAYSSGSCPVTGYSITGGTAGYFKITSALSIPNDNTIIALADSSGGVVAPGGVVYGTSCRIARTGTIPSGGGSVTVTFYCYADITNPISQTLTLRNLPSNVTWTPNTLSNAVLNTPYTATITASVSGVPVTVNAGDAGYRVSSGVLPAGITLNATTGVISGTPTVASAGAPFTISVEANSKTAYGDKVYTLPVDATGADLTVTSFTPTTATAGTSSQLTISGTNFNSTASNNKVEYGRSDFASLLQTATIVSGNATQLVVTINPNTAGPYYIRVTNLITSKSGEKEGLTVNAASGTTPIITSVTPTSVAANTTGTLTVNGSSLGASGTVGKILWRNVEYNATVNSTGTAATASNVPFGSSGSYTVGYVNPGGVSATVSGTNTVTVTSGTLGPILLGGVTAHSVEKSSTFNQTLTTTGFTGSVSWSVASDSPISLSSLGLSLSGAVVSGAISTGAQSGSVKFVATDTNGSTNSGLIAFTVTGGAVTFAPDPQSFVVRRGENKVFTLTATGGNGTYSWSSNTGNTNLPAGLSLNSNGTITGTCIESGTGDVSKQKGDVTVTSNSLSDTGTVQFTVKDALSQIVVTSITPNTGSKDGGTAVKITATGVASGFTVKFGNSVATVSSFNLATGEINVIAPASGAGATTVVVTITNLDGGTGTTGFTYVNIITPKLISLDKQDGPFAGGQDIVVTGQNFTASTTVKINNNVCSSTFISASQINAVTPSYGTPVDYAVPVSVTLTNEAGSEETPGAYTYRPAPIITGVTPPSGPSTGGTVVYITGKHFFERPGKRIRVFIGDVEISPDNIVLTTE